VCLARYKTTACSVLSVIDAHHPLDISATDRAAVAHTDESIDASIGLAQNHAWPQGTSATPSYLQMSMAPVMWKSLQSLQQVMLWPLAARRRHLRR